MMTLTFSIAAIALPLCFGVFLIIRRGRNLDTAVYAGTLGLVAALVFFDLMTALHPAQWLFWKKGALLVEAFLPAAFVLFSRVFYRRREDRLRSPLQVCLAAISLAFPVAVAIIPDHVFSYSPDFAEEHLIFLGKAGYLFYIGLLLFLTFSLFQLERTYRAMPRGDRWQAKFEMVGAGALITMLIVYYSQGLLYRSINMNLLPARSATIVVAVLLMIYSRLRRGEASRVRVSSEITFKSVAILAIGLYLLFLGLLGEGMRYLGESSQRTLLLLIAFLGGLALVVVLLSDTLRRKTRIFLHKNFFRQKYDYRSQWQQFTQWLTAARTEGETQGAILEFFTETFFVRGAALFMRETEREDYHCLARHDMTEISRPIRRGNPLTLFLQEKDWVFNFHEKGAQADVLNENMEFIREQDAAFAIPLCFDGQLEGFILLCSRIDPDETVNYEDYDLMKMLARQATSTLLSLRLSSQLATAREMAAIGKVSAFVMHDLKNLVSNLALVIENAGDNIDDPEFRTDMFETLTNTVSKMKGLIARLRTLEEKAELKLEECDLTALVAESAADVSKKSIALTGGPVHCAVDRVEIGKVVLNLALNALEATAGEGPVHLEVGAEGMAFIRCRDQGCGMEEEFIRERLFKPFETTKQKGFGIGLYQCRQIVEAHGGRIEVRSVPEQGSEFTVYLPLDLRSS